MCLTYFLFLFLSISDFFPVLSLALTGDSHSWLYLQPSVVTCVSLVLDVCFAPVVVVLLLGCGKIINMGCRLGERWSEDGGWSWCLGEVGICDSLTLGHCLFLKTV